MDSQGWFIGPNGEFLFWVPPYLRPCSLITDTMLVVQWPWVDVNHLIHGHEWQKIHGWARPPEDRNDESVSRARYPAWYKHLTSRHVTADQASSHVNLLQPALREGLAHAAFEGQYMIRVGFNEAMLQQGMLLEEIHLSLDGNLRLPEKEISMIFAPIFSPFPGIVFTPEETFYLRVDPPSQGVPESRFELQNSSGNSGTTVQGPGASGDPGKDSEGQKKESTKDCRRSYRETPDGGANSGGGSNNDDDDGEGKKSRSKGKERQRGPRVINIPFKSTLLTTGPKGDCDRFTTRARVYITVRVLFIHLPNLVCVKAYFP